ncbi:MAG: nickel-dependent hydrogenase large subunit, partial [Myxococcales bacterium]|nr:nickel-dependent hydrogenase large subunit [Myxococcales bacterium]
AGGRGARQAPPQLGQRQGAVQHHAVPVEARGHDPLEGVRVTEPAEGEGVGLADTGRGRLAHRVAWADGKVTRWDRVAPTEWTHHPDGVATRAPVGWPAAEAEARARWHMALLDPCVPFGVTVEGA